jgi:mycoredoxin
VHSGERETVVLFSASWCRDCRQTKIWLRDNDVAFTEVDVEHDDEARHQAMELAKGRPNIPVLVLPDGSVLVEPTAGELADAFLPNTT